MKITGLILIIIGSLLIVLEFFSRINSANHIHASLPENPAERIAYQLGYNMFIIAGIVLLFTGIFLRRKAKKKNKQGLVENLFKDERK